MHNHFYYLFIIIYLLLFVPVAILLIYVVNRRRECFSLSAMAYIQSTSQIIKPIMKVFCNGYRIQKSVYIIVYTSTLNTRTKMSSNRPPTHQTFLKEVVGMRPKRKSYGNPENPFLRKSWT